MILLLFGCALLASLPVEAEGACPDFLAEHLGGDRPVCRLLKEGRLESSLGNGDVIYRLYRRVYALEELAGSRYDNPPYNQVGIALNLAREVDGKAFWTGEYLMGEAWFQTPYLVTNAEYGEMLVVPGRWDGTGHFVTDHVFMPTLTAGWTRIGSEQSVYEIGQAWVAQLQAYLPEGMYIAKGVPLDYATLRGESAVWRRDDPNGGPSGGKVRFRLKLSGPERSLEVVEATYTP